MQSVLWDGFKRFVISEEKFNLSFLLKNTAQVVFIMAVVATSKIIIVLSDDVLEKFIAAFVFYLFCIVASFGLLQLILVIIHSIAKTNFVTKILIIFVIVCYGFMMATGMYAVSIIAKKYSSPIPISQKVDMPNKETEGQNK